MEIEYIGKKPLWQDSLYGSYAVFEGPGSVVDVKDDKAAMRLLSHRDIFRVAGSVKKEVDPEPEVEIKTLAVEVPDDVETVPHVDTVETMSDEEVMKLAKIHNLHSGKGRVNYDKLRAELAEALSAQARG